MEYLNHYRKFFEISNNLLCVANTDSYFLKVNPYFSELLGYSPQELTNRRFTDFIHPEDVGITLIEVEKLSKGIKVINFINRYRCKDGIYKSLEWTATPDVDQSEIFAVARDVTEELLQKREIEELNQSLKNSLDEMESFSYSVSHDLRAPVRAIHGFSRIISEKHGSSLNSEAQDLLKIIYEESSRMGKLIDDLLSFSRLGKNALQLTLVPMKELAQEAVNEVLRLNQIEPRPNIKIANLPDAYCDRSLVQQVLVNLISNAFKFSHDKPHIEVEIGYTENDSLIDYFVRDNGVGFDMLYYDKLFGIFQRLHSQEKFGGIGIGLANVQKIINRLGGEVWAVSQINEGATFYFSLPSSANNGRLYNKSYKK